MSLNSSERSLHEVPVVTKRNRRFRLHHNAPILGGAFVCVALALAAYPIYTCFYATTNDAQVDGHILPVSSRINGTVVWVNPQAEDTRYVAEGAVLARLDTRDYSPSVDRLSGEVEAQQSQLKAAQFDSTMSQPTAQSRLQAARASVSEAEADLSAAQLGLQSREAQLAQARVTFNQVEADRKRYEALVKTHEISTSEYDQRAASAATAREQIRVQTGELQSEQTRIEMLRHKLSERRAELEAVNVVPQIVGVAAARVHQTNGEVKESQARLAEAQLNLGYTTIMAPAAGIVGQRQIEAGQRVQSGQLLMTVVPLRDLWITANFKETQLRRMHVGQKAEVKVDAYSQSLHGHIESMGGATGARYSLLPPENATGNFVKVVQRVPVRIRIDDAVDAAHPLLPGMSTEVKVRLF